MAELLIDEKSPPLRRVDGYWTSSNTYLLSTPNGYAVLVYDSYLWVGLYFVHRGKRYERHYENVHRRYAVTLLKRFYYEVINNN